MVGLPELRLVPPILLRRNSPSFGYWPSLECLEGEAIILKTASGVFYSAPSLGITDSSWSRSTVLLAKIFGLICFGSGVYEIKLCLPEDRIYIALAFCFRAGVSGNLMTLSKF